MNAKTTLQNRTLFFGDNLQIIEEKIPSSFVDLIYLDPPFNSNKNYNVLSKEGQKDSSAQIRAFEDTWDWLGSTVELFEELKTNSNPQIAILISSMYEILGPSPMMAYLVNMTARLMPLKRVLKETGSIYLHCDPTASHYLKIVLDVIFGKHNFQNEIIWCYEIGARSRKKWGRKHDVILFYTRSENYVFNTNDVKVPRKEGTHMKTRIDEDGREFQEKKDAKSGKIYKYFIDEGAIPPDWWVGIQQLNREAKERLGYPTQKPEELLERIIKASSNEGDWILDPFCGCGTTVAVAEKLNRKWIGIDISMQAVNVIQNRMIFHYPEIIINIDGIPMDFDSAKALAEKDKFAFQDWAITIVSANPPSGESKKGADRGIDGIILFRDKVDYSNPKLRKIIVQVKGGNVGRGDIAKLKGDIEREDAPMGVLITLHEPTSEMKRESALAGEYKYTESVSFPRVQILSINDWFNGKEIKLPSDKVNPFKTAKQKSNQLSLID